MVKIYIMSYYLQVFNKVVNEVVVIFLCNVFYKLLKVILKRSLRNGYIVNYKLLLFIY